MKRVALAVLGLALLSSSAAVLENAELAIELDDASFAVRSIANRKAGGVKFVDAPAGEALWTAEFRAGAADAKSVRLTSNSPCRAKRLERTADGGAALVWAGLDLGDGQADCLLPRQDVGARFVRGMKKGRARRFGCMAYYPMMIAFRKGDAGLYIAAHDGEPRFLRVRDSEMKEGESC